MIARSAALCCKQDVHACIQSLGVYVAEPPSEISEISVKQLSASQQTATATFLSCIHAHRWTDSSASLPHPVFRATTMVAIRLTVAGLLVSAHLESAHAGRSESSRWVTIHQQQQHQHREPATAWVLPSLFGTTQSSSKVCGQALSPSMGSVPCARPSRVAVWILCRVWSPDRSVVPAQDQL